MAKKRLLSVRESVVSKAQFVREVCLEETKFSEMLSHKVIHLVKVGDSLFRTLTHSRPMFPFYIPGNVRKPLVF